MMRDEVRQALTAWHATHPAATFAEIEVAVEEQIRTVRAQLLEEYAGATWHEDCRERRAGAVGHDAGPLQVELVSLACLPGHSLHSKSQHHRADPVK